MIRSALAVAAASIAASVAFSLPIFGQEETDQRLGTVHFDISCNEVAQRRFDRAMRYQHSFWYRESKDLFEEVFKADPDCGIAYWGIALSLLNNPHAPPPVGNLALGLAAIEKGKAIGAKTQRERDFIDALAAFYTDSDKVDHRTRVLAYLKAMEGVAQAYPNDDEAQILYAIELNVAAAPSDKTYAMQLKGAAILEPIFQRQPRHPGVAHYLIHLYDTPALAQKGLDAAKRYSQIAPAAPHAQHMPSHIFTRVGYWKESIGSNTEAARSAKASNEAHDELHAMDYLVYAHLQMGQDAKAQAVIDEMRGVSGFTETFIPGPYALAVSPARYAIERGDWNAAAQLAVRSTPLAHVEAMTHFARAFGAARAGQPDAAKADVAKLAELREKLRAAKDAYWAEQVDIQWQVATAKTVVMKSVRLAVVLAAALVGVSAGYFALVAPRPAEMVTGDASAARPVWAEVKWPFPVDQWGTGRAFACNAADCGTEVKLYLRAKLGSCNCATGVAEDVDIDRMSDFDLA